MTISLLLLLAADVILVVGLGRRRDR